MAISHLCACFAGGSDLRKYEELLVLPLVGCPVVALPQAGRISTALRMTRGDPLAAVRKMVQDLILKMQAGACNMVP